jgi:predicted phosphoribosyltransferase
LLGIPNGGVPVAEGFATKLKIRYDILIVRKIKIPWNTEAGFGSITADGTILLNKPLYSQLNLSKTQYEKSVELTKSEIDDRIQLYQKTKHYEKEIEFKVKNKITFLIDDGLASGFSMLAAIKMVNKYSPRKIVITIPTAPYHTIDKIKEQVAEIYCPNIKKTHWFAVADAYQNWYDLSEPEVQEILQKSEFYTN